MRVNGTLLPWMPIFPNITYQSDDYKDLIKAQKQGFYAAMSIPFMDEKLGMYYNFFSKDINKV